MATLTTDARDFRLAFNTSGEAQAFGQGWTAFKNLLRDGTGDITPWAVGFIPPPPPPSLNWGLFQECQP
jgi:hypothetical protein